MEGIEYPFDEFGLRNLHQRAATAFVGNSMHLFRQQERMQNWFQELGKGSGDVLLSSETVIRVFTLGEQEEQIPFDLIQAAGFDKVRMLLFVRDPVEHAVSYWNQITKSYHTILYAALDDLMADYTFPTTIRRYLTVFLQHDCVELEVHNYSKCRKDIVTITERWLGLTEGSLLLPAVKETNRSMRPEELDILLQHKLKVDNGYSFKDHLLCWTPVRPSTPFVPTFKSQQELWNRNAQDIAFINSLLPADEKLEFTVMEGKLQHEGPICFSEEQLQLIISYYLNAIVSSKSPVLTDRSPQRGRSFFHRVFGRLVRLSKQIFSYLKIG